MTAIRGHVETAELRAIARGRHGDDTYAVTFTDTKPPKLILPPAPAHDDPAALCAWLTSVFRLDPRHPVTGAVHEGLRGADGHVQISRAGTHGIRFEPAGAVNTARRLLPALGWQLLPTDLEPYGFKDEHGRRIAHVLRLLCGISRDASEQQETAGILGTFVSTAAAVDGFTIHGTGAQRYEALMALQRDVDEHTGRPYGGGRYLSDRDTGELVIRVSDLQAAARAHVGASLPRGWLDARMDSLGWDRRTLDGRQADGRAGRHSPHARAIVYIGHLPDLEDDGD